MFRFSYYEDAKKLPVEVAEGLRGLASSPTTRKERERCYFLKLTGQIESLGGRRETSKEEDSSVEGRFQLHLHFTGKGETDLVGGRKNGD